MSNYLWPHELQHARLPCPSLSPRICSNSCPLSQWCHRTISSSVVPFSSCLQSFPATESFPESVLHTTRPKYWSFGISPSNEYSGLISFRMTGWISLQSKGLSSVFSNTTVQKQQFFGAQLSLCPPLTSIRGYWKISSHLENIWIMITYGAQPLWIQGNSKVGDGISVLGKNFFNYR